MSIKLKFEGFEDLLKDIEAAGRSIDSTVESVMTESAYTMQNTLKTEMQNSQVPQNLIDAMPNPEIQKEGNTIIARVGYRKGAYNPDNISDGYKIVFLNYGTPRRSKHGKIDPNDETKRGFIQRAKASAKKVLRKKQKQALERILSRVQK